MKRKIRIILGIVIVVTIILETLWVVHMIRKGHMTTTVKIHEERR